MKTETQNSPDLAALSKLLENIKVAMMTNLDGEGALVGRPMAPLEMDAQGAIWFFTDMRSAKIEHLTVVNLGFADAERATYVSISGRGELHADKARVQRLWTAMARPWFPDGPESEHLALLKFVPDRAEYWDAPNSKMVRVFALAASVAAGKPIGMGEHGTLTALSGRSARAAPPERSARHATRS